MQGNCKFREHVKTKLFEANKCLSIISSLRKEGYTQEEVDTLFNAIVLSKYCMAFQLTLLTPQLLPLFNAF